MLEKDRKYLLQISPSWVHLTTSCTDMLFSSRSLCSKSQFLKINVSSIACNDSPHTFLKISWEFTWWLQIELMLLAVLLNQTNNLYKTNNSHSRNNIIQQKLIASLKSLTAFNLWKNDAKTTLVIKSLKMCW